MLSVAFEDTGVRAYKGQAIAEAARTFLKSPALLTKALTIHSVEARHAARVRQLLGFESWFPGAFPDAPRLIKPIYATDPSLPKTSPPSTSLRSTCSVRRSSRRPALVPSASRRRSTSRSG